MGLPHAGSYSFQTEKEEWDSAVRGGCPEIESEDGKEVDIIAGVIRNVGGVWEFVEDSAHFGSSGLLSLTSNSFTVSVNFKKTYGKVISFLATPDETYVNNGVSCGSSVGVSSADITLFQNKSINDYITWNGSSWTTLRGDISVSSYNNGIITISHSMNMNGFNINASLRDSSGGGFVGFRIGSINSNSAVLRLQKEDGTLYTGVEPAGLSFYVNRQSSGMLTKTESAIASSNIWIFGAMQKA
tara:strand:- start:320 stop:1048 length:729 start_codon:yes stop_codon:yes gene_type:complete